MSGPRKLRDLGLTALLVAPDREITEQFNGSLQDTRGFQILAELKSYPPSNTLDIRLRQLRPDVVLIDVATDLTAACELIRFLGGWKPALQVVGLHRTNDSAAVVQVLRAGASEFLYAPFDPAVQREAIARLRRLRPAEEGDQELGKVVVFTSAKPGSGSSTLATHTAFSLRKSAGKRVLLVDFDLEGGTAAFYLKLQPKQSVIDALSEINQMDAATWASLTLNSSGVDVLAAPEQPFTGQMDPSRLHGLLEFARMLYDWVVVDAPTLFHRTSLLLVSESDQAYVVATSDLASLHLARKAGTMMTQLGFGRERYQMVINRLSKKDGIGGSDIEKIFNAPVHASVPNDYFSLHRVISLGQPLQPDCELGRAIATLASRISSFGAPEKKAAIAGDPKAAASQT